MKAGISEFQALKLWVAGFHVVNGSPGDLWFLLFILVPDRLLHIIWRILGDFRLKCEHVRRGAKPSLVFPIVFRRRGKILYRARVEICRQCALLLP